jgi:hypothetical protein
MRLLPLLCVPHAANGGILTPRMVRAGMSSLDDVDFSVVYQYSFS